MKFSLILVFALCAAGVFPATSISRWFSSSYLELRVTLKRYGSCIGELAPLKDRRLNETEFLIHQMRVFLDEANYDNEQLTNVSALMDNICRPDLADSSYPISLNINVTKYSNSGTGKENRCRAIDEAMDSMYNVFRRAALNKSEPLDFSTIQYHPDPTDKEATYNLTDLINTSWIKSDILMDHVCKITDSVKGYVQTRLSNTVAQKRLSQQPGMINTLIGIIDSILDVVLVLEKRIYWESTNRFEQAYSGISHQLGYLRDGIGSRLRSTRARVVDIFTGAPVNVTTSTLNSTLNQNVTTPLEIVSPILNLTLPTVTTLTNSTSA